MPEDAKEIRPAQNRSLLPDNPKMRLLLLVIGVVTICGALYAVPSVNRAIVQATTKQPEPFTELYITNPSQLNKTFKPNTKQTIEFTIQNHEGQTTTYPYAVYLDQTKLASGTVTLAPNEKSAISETILLKSTKSRAKITITLLSTNQSIHYWTEKE
jgi:hypothetical protein